ncbi:MAG: carbohydrate kinase [Anaerolineae bacterium]|nr:carbohydrate kinase [Anaerolineae bacterium]
MLLLGIDCGSTVVKASLIDASRGILASLDRRVPSQQPHPGWAERDMSALWQSVSDLIHDLLAQTDVDPADIQAVGCTGHGNGVYLLDTAHQPLGQAILSVDNRARDLLKSRLDDGLHARIFPLTVQKLYPAQTAVLLLWLKQHQPDRYGRIDVVLLCKDFINFCLTGVIATDYTDMSATSLMDVPNRCYSLELLLTLRLEELEGKLPPLQESTAIIGYVTEATAHTTGLRTGTPVIAGMIDIAASAIGAGLTQPGQACIIAGTWSINEVIVDQPLYHPDLFLTSIFADPTRWLLVEASATSTTNLEWVIDLFCVEEKTRAAETGVSVYDVCESSIASVPVETQDVIFHPFAFDTNAHPTARAGFYGLTGWHSRAHVLRAVYEGIAFGHRYHLERLAKAGAVLTKARLTGGAARSSVWSQMFADVLGLPLEVPEVEETGTVGIALAAGVGIGHYASLDKAVEANQVRRIYIPDTNTMSHYDRRYQLYTQLLDVLPPVWDTFAQFP